MTTTESTEPTSPATKPDASLTLQDLAGMTQIIQLGTERGAWKVEELSSIGALYDRVVAFLTAAGVVQPKIETDPK